MTLRFKNILRKIFRVLLYLFAIIGFIFTGVFFAMRLHLTDVKGSIDSRNSFFDRIQDPEIRKEISNSQDYDWVSSPEWLTLKDALIKDKDVILEVSNETGIPSRILVSSIISEQFRFFTSNREAFKKYFEPLKILGNYTQFSYGISGVKMDTAKKIEENLKDIQSPFYLGKDYENILDYKNLEDIDNQRLLRFTDSHDHYYSYLYTAIYLKQIINQWQNASFSISNRPEVLATLFNIGFTKSVPKFNPEVGGSIITINNIDYTFGGLAYEFYYSGELSDVFPLGV
jgi:hypothetical protein